MAKGGRRYPLVIYTVMIDRWRPVFFTLGLAMLGITWALYSRNTVQWRWLTMGSVSVFMIFVSIMLTLMRKSAYIQPFQDYFKLVTPFLRLNISYKRVRRASSANFGALFPKNSVTKWQAEIIEPLAKMTAIVIELNGFPMKQSSLKLFLSPLFFKDKTPHFVILINDWMQFSSELDSWKTGLKAPAAPQKKRDSSPILSRLPPK